VGVDGFSPTVSVSESTPEVYVLNVTDKNGSYSTPNLRGTAVESMTSANLSEPQSSVDVSVGNLIYTAANSGENSLTVQLRSKTGGVLADVNKFAQYNSINLNSTALDKTTFTTVPTTVDAMVYNNSNERHLTQIRQQDPETGLWSVHEVNLFTSAGGSRTDIWVRKIAAGLSY
jgi:hypothetical protein